MSGPRDFTRTSARREKVARLYLQGQLQSEIARAMHVTQSCIAKDLASIRQTWRETAVKDIDVLQQEELQRIAAVAREAWECFTRSKQESEITLNERSNGRDKVSLRTEKQVGDPRWLAIIVTCVEKRCAILGLQMPQRHVIAWDSLTDAQLLALANGQHVATVLAMPAQPSGMAEA